MHQQYVTAMKDSGVEPERIGRIVRIVMVDRFKSSLFEKVRNAVIKEKAARHEFHRQNGLPDPTPFLLDDEAVEIRRTIERIIGD